MDFEKSYAAYDAISNFFVSVFAVLSLTLQYFEYAIPPEKVAPICCKIHKL